MHFDVRAITDEEVPAFRAALIGVFGGDTNPDADPVGNERYRALIPTGRSWAAFDRQSGLIVGTAGTFDFSMTLPGGGQLPFAGLTMVTVRPTHRRRGVLRGLMAAHLEEARGRGLAVSALWASEASIYGRFGYGVATESDDLGFVGPELRFVAAPIDDVEPLEGTAAAVLPPIYDAVRAARPGMITRPAAWWRYRRFMERPEMHKGASARRHAVARRDGAATGYIVYRHRGGWEQGLPTGTLEIEELIAADARAERTLWRFAANVDLFPRVSHGNAPVDCVLPWIVEDPRRVRRRRTDAMWLRVEDVETALAARGYAVPGRLSIEVLDPPATRGPVFALSAEGGRAGCAPTSEDPDLRMDRAALGSLLLGTVRASLLARAGRIAGSAAALALADALFETVPPPWCAEIF